VAVGVYGVTAYVVSRRRREMAIRIALGAGQPAILAGVLRSSAVLLATGIAVGLPVSIGTRSLLAADPAANPAYDPWIATLGVATIVVVGMLACLVPALRAARVDPVQALRDE
jgi:putative ABC transport system permease protein